VASIDFAALQFSNSIKFMATDFSGKTGAKLPVEFTVARATKI